MFAVGGVHDDVAHAAARVDLDQVDRADHPARLADRARHLPEQRPALSSSWTRIVRRYCALGVMLTCEWLLSVEGPPSMASPGAASASIGRRSGSSRQRSVKCSAHGDRATASRRLRASGGGTAPLPDRRPQPRLPRLLRAARVDRDLHRRADQRDLRVRLDARQDRHRVRRAARRSSPGTPAPRGAPSCSPSTRPSAARARTCSSSSGRRWNRWWRRSATATCKVEGYEADDVIASLAERALAPTRRCR